MVCGDVPFETDDQICTANIRFPREISFGNFCSFMARNFYDFVL